jgi:hypothetical protein
MKNRSRLMRVGLLLAGLGVALVSWLGQGERIQQAQALWSDGVAAVVSS